MSIPLDDGTQTVVDIFTTDDFFGESSLLGAQQYTERALALDNVTLTSRRYGLTRRIDRLVKGGGMVIEEWSSWT